MPRRPVTSTLGKKGDGVYRLSCVLLAVALCNCATAPSSTSTSPDPYPGSGGLFLVGAPSRAEVESGKANFSEKRFASFKVGVTTKLEVVQALGAPAGWSTEADGTSQLEYDYVTPVDPLTAQFGMPMRRVVHTFFTFDASRHVLTDVIYPGHDDRPSPPSRKTHIAPPPCGLPSTQPCRIERL